MARLSKFNFAAALAVCALVLAGCGDTIKNAGSARGSDIICFGDSLTAGRGAPEGADYPSVLGQLVKRRVVNAGASGETSGDGMARLERDVTSRRPYMVIIEFGGNDFLRGVAFSDTMANIDAMILAAQSAGAIAVVADTGGSRFLARYSGEFRRLAKRRRAVFVPAILDGLFNSPALMSDDVHPNAQGYKLIAEKIYKKVAKYL